MAAVLAANPEESFRSGEGGTSSSRDTDHGNERRRHAKGEEWNWEEEEEEGSNRRAGKAGIWDLANANLNSLALELDASEFAQVCVLVVC